MRIFNKFVFLGLCILCATLDFLFETDFHVVRSELGAAAIGAIAGGSALLSGIGNLISSADTNRTNERINERNLQFNKEENEKSRKFSHVE